ncbi:MAG TPA: hypothetical protein VEY11_19735 [Pyrinomonadaceae bacterium]|nr:hypothetical protein [Pyrinomonadaceae bacterium]
MSESQNNSQQDEIIKYLRANLLLQLLKLGGDENEQPKPEVLLNQAGFSHGEIADLLGKSYGAVKQVVRRSKIDGKDKEA